MRLRRRFAAGFAAGYVNGMLAVGIGALVVMLFADWILPFVYNIGFQGFQASVLVWLFMGGLVALENMPDPTQNRPSQRPITATSNVQPATCDLSIIIVNWNTRDLLAQCLRVAIGDHRGPKSSQASHQSPITDHRSPKSWLSTTLRPTAVWPWCASGSLGAG